MGAGPKTTRFSNFLNSKECFKCRGYEYIASDCPNYTIVTIIEEDIPTK